MHCNIFYLAALVCITSATAAAEVDYATERDAVRDAVENVADCVVQIRTVGGFERVGDTQVSQGPTSGLIISADGYIVSSAFNFAQRPSSVLVALAGGRQLPAELVARDLNRMLVLLKVDADQRLTIPTFVPERDIAVGQSAIALGRTFQTETVDTSLGIISGLNRMHGRAIQTDCSVSAANYGGPLVDLRGRVFGILVPMSPQSGGEGPENEVAGVEFYDSGIGFAVPLEHVFSILERWKQGEDLVPGKLGVSMKGGSAIVEPPVIVTVWPRSPAAEAGWKAHDTIIAVNGHAVRTQNELQFHTKRLYAGDTLTVSLCRGSGEGAEEFDSDIELVAELASYRAAFLGVLPAVPTKDNKDQGIIVEHLWPDSPAARAGIVAGDRITKLGETGTPSLTAALLTMKALQPQQEVGVAVTRGDESLKFTAELATLPEQILSAVELGIETPSEPAEARKLENLKLPQFPQETKYLTPADKWPAPCLMTWLAATAEEEATVAKLWQPICDSYGIVLLIARPADEAGWQFEDLEYLDQLTRTARAKFRADPLRSIVAGSGKAGQLAYALGLRRRGSFSGIVADNAPLPRTMKVPENTPTDSLSVLAVLPKKSPLAPLVKHDVEQLRAAGYPVSTAERVAALEDDEGQLDETTIATIARWIAGLRRL